MTSPPRTESGVGDDATAAALSGLFGRDAIYMSLWAVQLILAAVLTPITTRLLGADHFGLAASAVAVMQVLVALCGFSLQTAVQRADANDPQGARKLVMLAGILSVVTCALAYLTGPLWCPILGLGDFPPIVQFAVLWAGCTGISNAAIALLRSRDRLASFAFASLMQSLVAEAAALLFVAFVSRTATMYVGVQAACQALTVAFALLATRPVIPRRHDLPLLSGALRFSVGLVPAAVAAFVFDASDRLVIQASLGPTAVGRYAVARNVGGLVLALLVVMNNVWMPRLFKLGDRKLERSVLAASRDVLYSLVALALLGIALGSPVVLSIWAPPSYHPAQLELVTVLIAAAAAPLVGAQTATRLLLLNNRTMWVAAATMLSAAVNLGLNIALVPVFGIDGAAAVSLFSYCLQFALLGWVAGKMMRLSRPPARVLGAVAFAFAISIAATALPWNFATIAIRFVLAVVLAGCFILQALIVVAPARAHRFGAIGCWLPIPHPSLKTNELLEG